MKTNLSKAPSYRAGPIRLADFTEILALRGPRFKASQVDVISALDRLEDEDEDKFEGPIKDAFTELGRRADGRYAIDGLYPFEIEKDSILLPKGILKDETKLLYIFLLLTTTLNMKSERKFASLDGADLFELLSKEVAVNFFGGRNDKRVKARVFGTSRKIWDTGDDTLDQTDISEFGKAINELCKFLGEGDEYRPKTSKVSARDDKLDIVVCRDFSDGMHAKLSAFGQCKTGTHWGNELPRLQPHNFCNRWFSSNPTVMPVKFYFLADRVSSDQLRHHGYEAGILFERCRILDYAHDLPPALLKKCATWTRAAMKEHKLGTE